MFPLTISFLAYLVLFTRAPSPLNSSSSQPLLFFSFLSFPFLFFSFFLSFLSTSSQFFHPSSATALCTSISINGNLLVHTLCILLTFCSHRVTLLLISVTIQILSVRSLQPLLQYNRLITDLTVSSTASTLSLFAVLYLEHILSIAVSSLFQCYFQFLLMCSECCKLPRNSHTKSDPFSSTMQKNMSRKSAGIKHHSPAFMYSKICP